MEEISSEDALKVRNGWSRLGKVGLALMVFVWLSVLLPLLENVLSSVIALPKEWQDVLKNYADWLFQHPLEMMMGVIILALITLVFFLLSRLRSSTVRELQSLPVNITINTIPQQFTQQKTRQLLAKKELERRYLERLLHTTEWLKLTGIPAGLVAPRVALDEVFIPLQFFPKQLPSDYPLSGEEFADYRELLRRGVLTEEMERILIEFEKKWEALFKKDDRISVAQLWQSLDRNNPAAVIQGYPGMGKSTLMIRLALHLARLGLDKPDPMMGQPLYQSARTDSGLLPILLLLKDYATELKRALDISEDLPLLDYVKMVTERISLPGLFPFLQECLTQGRCLVMLDGLDEVSELTLRKQVKQRLEAFILDQRDSSKNCFNRFLITSRVAGYDVVAFADYLHYTIAPLIPEQIQDFLPRWCQASVRRGGHGETEEVLAQEAHETARKLSAAMQANQGVRTLAENPLLLTLLAVMQQNSIELPRQRVELYTAVVKTLLENRNLAKDLKPIPEALAIQRLGPIAYRMQEAENGFARRREVEESLRNTIKNEEGGTDRELDQEVENFLGRVRERGGLFVIRTGDYFGFFHRTFQEYFAARYLLNQIKRDPGPWVTQLVGNARRSDDLWREPFLLAVAYQSGEDEMVARTILEALLDIPSGTSLESKEHDLLLAVECVIDSKPSTLGRTLEKRIAEQLLQTYEQAQRLNKFKVCEQIEDIVRRWLLSLPGEAYRPALPTVLSEAISDMQQAALQRSALTLLSMVAQELADSPDYIFDLLIAPLLALSHMPTVGKYQPTAGMLVATDLNVADLALTLLSFFGKRGPAGLLLSEVRQHFRDDPKLLRWLAHLSLLCGTLLTPAIVPLPEARLKRYGEAIARWIALRETYQKRHITEQNVDDCQAIHEDLLACAEEVCYPTAMHLLKLVQSLGDVPLEGWEQACQDYVLEQLQEGPYTSYQGMALLFAALFPAQHLQERLASCITSHYSSTKASLQQYAQRFIASLSVSQSYLKDLRDLRNLSSLRDLSYLSLVRDLGYLRELRQLRQLNYLNYLSNLRNLGYLRNRGYLSYLSDLGYLKDLGHLRDLLLSKEMVKKVLERLSTAFRAIDVSESADLLTILLGRVLQVASKKPDEANELEMQRIVEIVKSTLLVTEKDTEKQEVALNILRYLPARSSNEIRLVIRLAEEANDEEMQNACVLALEYARPVDDAWEALAEGSRSKVEGVRRAVEEMVRRKEI